MSQFLTHPVPAVVILLGLLVFFHELGHYVVGRLCGIAVETFSIGFGPRIFGFTHRGTEYRISWIPLGGFVKFAGSHPSEEVPPGLKGRAFLKTSVTKRAATVMAGPLANFILAITVYTVLGLDGIPHPPPLIGDVVEGSPAAAAGIRYGDLLTRIDDRPIKTWRDLEEVISSSPGKRLTVTVDRDGRSETLSLTPDAVKTPDMLGKPATVGRAGLALGRVPAIVSVLKSDGAGARAGLTTGDQILAVESHGKTTPVTYFPALADALRAAAAGPEASPTAQLKVVAAPVPAEKDDSPAHGGGAPAAPGPERTVTLALDPLKALPPTASNREVMAALGLADAELTVADVTDGAVGRLHPGDVVTAWNGTPLRDVFSLREVLIANTKSEADLTVLRDMAGPVKSSDSAETGGGKPHAPNLAVLTVKVPLKGIEAQRPDGTFTVYTPPILFWGQPAEPPPVIERYDNLVAALGFGLRQTGEQTRELVNNVVSLITGDIPLKALGGPMLIAKVAGDSARRGWQTFLGSLALISINLGILNLFPIPVLDGGQLVLMGAEAVRRRPLREAAVENFQKIGFAMILALVVLATYNDLSRFWKSMLESVVGLFQ